MAKKLLHNVPDRVRQLIEIAVDDTRAAKNRVPHLKELVEHIIAEWGGPKDFAASFFKEFKDAKSGPVRAKMMGTVVDLIKVLAATGDVTQDLEILNEQDLKTYTMALIGAERAEEEDVEP